MQKYRLAKKARKVELQLKFNWICLELFSFFCGLSKGFASLFNCDSRAGFPLGILLEDYKRFFAEL